MKVSDFPHYHVFSLPVQPLCTMLTWVLHINKREIAMNYLILRLIALSICLYTGETYTMERELDTLSSDKDTLDFLESMPTVDDFDIQYDHEKELNTLESAIRKRKWASIVYSIATLGLLGTDIANAGWSEKSLFEQRFTNNHASIEFQPCECPNQTISCTTSNGFTCELTFGSKILYGINGSMPIWRLCNGVTNMYYLYIMQHALETHAITKKIEDIPILGWVTQLLSAATLGGITSMAATLNGIHSYPRTVATWGMNALLDVFGTYNWHKNSEAVRELVTFKVRNGIHV